MHHLEVAGRVGVAGGVLELTPHGGSRMHVGAVLEKRSHDGHVPLFDSPHERGLPAQLFAGVDVGAAADEQLDRFGAAAPGSRHERCLARLELRRSGSRRPRAAAESWARCR